MCYNVRFVEEPMDLKVIPSAPLCLLQMFLLIFYIQMYNSYTIARDRFCAHVIIRYLADAPSKNLWVRRFRQTSTAVNVKCCGCPRSGTAPENVEVVRAAIIQNPSENISGGNTQIVFHITFRRHLRLHPYNIQIVQQMKPQ